MVMTKPSRSRVLAALAAVVFTASLPETALAKPSTNGKEEFDRAARYYKAQEYEAALPWFQKAYELSGKRPSSIRALAQCERSLKMYDEAIIHFREYLATNPPAAEAKSVKKTIDLLEELKTSRDAMTAAQGREPAEITPPIGSAPVEIEKPRAQVEETPKVETPAVTKKKTEKRVETTTIDLRPAPTEVPKYTPPLTTTETYREPESNVLPYITIGGGAALTAFGAALFAIGRSDVSKVESAADGTPYTGEIADAAGRAPTFTGLGAGLLIAGLAGTGIGIAWLVSDDDDELVTGTTISTSDRGAP
jgi:tetratricopeptide (TPR) repeat protein